MVDRRCFHKLLSNQLVCPLDDRVLLDGYNACVTKRHDALTKLNAPAPLPNLSKKPSRLNSQP